MRTFTLPGGLAGPPSACSCADDRVDVFATAGVVWRWSLTGQVWAPPVPLLLGPVQVPAEGVCAVASGPGRVEVFAVDRASGLPAWWRGVGAVWLPANLLPPGPQLSAQAVAAVAISPDDIHVVAAGPGNQPWWWHWDGRSWSPPAPLGQGGLPVERLAIVSPSLGRVDVFGAGAGNHLWHWTRLANGQWRPPEDLGGDLSAEGLAAVSWGPGRVDVFAASRASGFPVQHWWSTGGGFSRDQLPTQPPDGADHGVVAATVSAVSHAPDRLDVFGVTGDARIAHWQWDGSAWAGPNHYGKDPYGRFPGVDVPAGDVSAVVRVEPGRATWPAAAASSRRVRGRRGQHAAAVARR